MIVCQSFKKLIDNSLTHASPVNAISLISIVRTAPAQGAGIASAGAVQLRRPLWVWGERLGRRMTIRPFGWVSTFDLDQM